jgi:F0F1-type ATP synthase assembly protein I
MTKGEKKTVRVAPKDDIERYAAAMSARQQFVSAAFDMGWRLALTVLVPVFIGAWLDKRYDASPTYALTALFLSMAAAGFVVAKTLKDLGNNRNGKEKN